MREQAEADLFLIGIYTGRYQNTRVFEYLMRNCFEVFVFHMPSHKIHINHKHNNMMEQEDNIEDKGVAMINLSLSTEDSIDYTVHLRVIGMMCQRNCGR